MENIAIRVDNLAKRYQIAATRQRHDTLRDELVASAKKLLRPNGRHTPRTKIFWALRDVSFEVERGEVVGIIGRNGAGKSTLLKILSRITVPTSGQADIFGRVGSLLEVGTGFHPELTGRENIYLNGAILGMKRAELNRKFDEIVAFAEIEPFIDTPVKRYSSGMYVRLAFAVAAHLDLEIMFVDEVLAVGDAAFQSKCLGKMGEVAKGGRTVLFVSHSMATIQQLCPRTLLMAGGRLVSSGPTDRVVSEYLSDAWLEQGADYDLSRHPARSPKHQPIIRRLALISKDGVATTRFYADEPLIAELTLEPVVPIRRANVGISILDSTGRTITTLASSFQGRPVGDIETPCKLRCTLPQLRLGSGRYLLSVGLWTNYEELDVIHNAVWFEVDWRNNFGNGEPYFPEYGPVLTTSTWERLD